MVGDSPNSPDTNPIQSEFTRHLVKFRRRMAEPGEFNPNWIGFPAKLAAPGPTLAEIESKLAKPGPTSMHISRSLVSQAP